VVGSRRYSDVGYPNLPPVLRTRPARLSRADFQKQREEIVDAVLDQLETRFKPFKENKILKACMAFDHRAWSTKPWDEQDETEREAGLTDIDTLIAAWKPLLQSMGVDIVLARSEFIAMKEHVSTRSNLSTSTFERLYTHLFNHAGDDSKRGTTAVPSFFNALCLVMMAMTLAVDTSICERAFSLMNRLKSAKRNR
jgi:hypothetical protein